MNGARILAQQASEKMKQNIVDAKTAAKGAIERARRAFIGNKEDIPEYLQDNEYIISGYRVNHDSCCEATKSLFTCHNESVNIWSHLLGAVLFLCLFVGLCCLLIPFRFKVGRSLIQEFEN